MNKKAFTLIELLVVIAIIGILSGLIVVSMNGATDAAKDGRRKADIDTIRKALLMYSVQNNGTYPVQSSQCNIGNNCSTLISAISSYLPTAPTDPNGTYYTYQSSGTDCTIIATLSNGSLHQYSCSTGFSTVAPFNCGTSTVSFTYNGSGATYGTILSSTGKCFMDRNLGATQVATAYNDSSSYGDLFQWGRLIDGHQIRTSTTTTVLSATDTPVNGSFIYGMASPYDWRSPKNDNLWQGVSGINNPCPTGWRIPTQAEWQAEITAGITNYTTAYSRLKMTATGYRGYSSASLSNVGIDGYYWSSSINSDISFLLTSNSGGAGTTSLNRAYGFSVRCIQN